MQKKTIQALYKELVNALTDKKFLKKIKLSKKAMLSLLQNDDWKKNIEDVIEDDKCTCTEILQVSEKTLNSISMPPEKGWFDYIYKCSLNALFPESTLVERVKSFEIGRFFYLEVLKLFLRYEKRNLPFDPKLNMLFLTSEEMQKFSTYEEYLKFTNFCRDNYIYEFMRIGREITPYNTLGHIAGVHFVSMYVARQLLELDVPIDLALVSGAAAGHDIGKYGCKGAEVKRIPYLHYYYTDKFFKQNDMPTIGHIATNHSTWDLELENLSVESLVLIYADFRVKATRDEQGVEHTNFYSLDESFNVILNKLDNVDEEKTMRYKHVYAKLKDFEDYMISLGVNVDLTTFEIIKQEKKDPSLLNPNEAVEMLKHLAIQHNISLMHKLNSETAYGNLLEAARSEKRWKGIRAYINILEEYFTYMTQKQKNMTINFLQELLMHREGDIRRQAADLIGNIIVNYDEEYRKEIPDDATWNEGEITSMELWEKTLNSIVFPDHKITDQHRRWIGYALKIVVESVLKRCKEEDRGNYLKEFLVYFDDFNIDYSTAFILLDSIRLIPLDMCDTAQIFKLLKFTEKGMARNTLEINICALRFLKHLTDNLDDCKVYRENIDNILSMINNDNIISILFLKYKILKNLDIKIENESFYEKKLYEDNEATSDIFLENLKVATPWVIKAVNLELLRDQVKLGRNKQTLHVATHLSNLIKVSERVAVRHRAGKALLVIVPLLSLDQRNEVVIELTKGLEIGEYEFSKYIPQYLGELALYLHPNELDEFINNLNVLLESNDYRVGSVALNTLGILIQNYLSYRTRFIENEEIYQRRRKTILGMILRGLSNYRDAVSKEAFLVIGQYIFGSNKLTLEDKYDIFQIIYKKMLTLIVDQKETELSFFNNAASLNHIYRFISDYIFKNGKFDIKEPSRVAFFPGTFDPFSLSHKGIVQEIRNLGFEVYLALDEFSWSKKTQPRMIRRKIINMSVSNEENVYIFPDDIPVNIANPSDLKRLKELFYTREIYIVVGSDVIINASSYKVPLSENSIHSFNHIVFRRNSSIEGADSSDDLEMVYENIIGKVVELTLPIHLEEISSTRIRENIDYNRDISNLIDPIAQSFIYDNSLYLREPQYKYILQAKAILIELVNSIKKPLQKELTQSILKEKINCGSIRNYLSLEASKATVIRDKDLNNEVVGLMLFHQLSMSELYGEFKNTEIAAQVREHASGKILVISGMFASNNTNIRDIYQITLTETLAYALENDFSYAIYHNYTGVKDEEAVSVLERQGFLQIEESDEENPIYKVDIKFPIALIQNVDTTIKEPFNRNERIMEVMDEAHEKLQRALTTFYPGNLVLSFNSGVMHHRLMTMTTNENNVPCEPLKPRVLGNNMCVPFGKILRGMAVPNTVTKSLHTEKVFDSEIKQFKITEFPYYSPLINQIKTIKSFNRPIMLVDDLLHKGYRMKELDPLFKKENIDISKIIVGILSGRGKDLMTIQGREVESVYFIPNLRIWFVESSMYPFIGGDSVEHDGDISANLLSSINLVLPYVAPTFLVDVPKKAVYEFSMTCLENARSILQALEEEYQLAFERNLTLNRLSEAVISPRCPDRGGCLNYDLNLAPSAYIENDIEKLIRLKNIIF
ncbi:nicotinate-nicotinamide nucleotide adenylyltransferase [Anaerovorax odorimutans]|uniref:nicotinate-nicotinamide nucleotide adenylyltransferase n=1 Tax=Anaerovorax odorimutans TaxID=109327 RepID=UPI00040EE23D|nr:hypothetical protein [Anaerovorax odorimutans]